MKIIGILFDEHRSPMLSAPVIAIISFVPSYFFSHFLVKVFDGAGNDAPPFKVDSWNIVGVVLLGPLVETLVLAIFVIIFGFFTRRVEVSAFFSATFFAMLHGLYDPFWGLSIFWPFLVFSYSYLVWRKKGVSDAVGVAWISHSIHNGFGLLSYHIL